MLLYIKVKQSWAPKAEHLISNKKCEINDVFATCEISHVCGHVFVHFVTGWLPELIGRNFMISTVGLPYRSLV